MSASSTADDLTLRPDLYVFSNDVARRTPRRPDLVTKKWAVIRRQADVTDDVELRSLRNWHITALREAGFPLEFIGRRVGHEGREAVSAGDDRQLHRQPHRPGASDGRRHRSATRADQRATGTRDGLDGGATSVTFIVTMSRPASALIAHRRHEARRPPMSIATRPTRKHLDVACPTCAAQVGERCVTVRRLPWMERWAAPTHPAHSARQLLSADPPAGRLHPHRL